MAVVVMAEVVMAEVVMAGAGATIITIVVIADRRLVETIANETAIVTATGTMTVAARSHLVVTTVKRRGTGIGKRDGVRLRPRRGRRTGMVVGAGGRTEKRGRTEARMRGNEGTIEHRTLRPLRRQLPQPFPISSRREPRLSFQTK